MTTPLGNNWRVRPFNWMSENKCGFMNVCISPSFRIILALFSLLWLVLFVLLFVAGILNPRVEDILYMLYLSYLPRTFLAVLQVGDWEQFFSLHTHFSCMYHEWNPKTLGLKKFRNRGTQWYRTGCTSYFGFHENLNQSLFSLFPVHKLVVYRQLWMRW